MRRHLDQDVDLTHAARADLGGDSVWAELGAGGEGHERGHDSSPAGETFTAPQMPDQPMNQPV